MATTGASDATLRALIDQAPDGVVVAAGDGLIVFANQQAQQLLGDATLEGRPLADALPGLPAGPADCELGVGDRPLQVFVRPVGDGCTAIHLRDVTERRALERSNADLEQFAYVASHDLSAPLHSVEGFTRLLRDRYAAQLDEAGAEFIEHTQSAVRRMRKLIDDLLAYSRVSSSEVPAHGVDTAAAASSALMLLSGQVAAASASVTIGDLPAVRGDERRIIQLFENLVGNAIKFRSPERPLAIELAAEPAPPGWVGIAVRDNGIGIEPRFADRIFRMFERLHSAEEIEGTGIGLAICKRIVEQHGGEITVDSTPDQGATFSFTLPSANA
jgi:light-regulated signal transduction histidine kinase (bacteriophytochrome)